MRVALNKAVKLITVLVNELDEAADIVHLLIIRVLAVQLVLGGERCIVLFGKEAVEQLVCAQLAVRPGKA